jgi:hypothetical protein
LGNVRAVRTEEGGQEREAKFRGCNLSSHKTVPGRYSAAMMQISELTYEIDDDSAIAEAAGRVTEEGVAVRRIVDPHGHDWRDHDESVASIDVRVSKSKHRGEALRGRAQATETETEEEDDEGEERSKAHGCKARVFFFVVVVSSSMKETKAR